MSGIDRRGFVRRGVAAAAAAALARCSKDEPPSAEVTAPALFPLDDARATLPVRGIQATWNERMKAQGSHVAAARPEDAWFTPADVARIRSAGATIIEIHQLGLPDLMPTRGVPNRSFFEGWVDHWVAWCSANQLECILTITGIDARADWAIALSLVPWLWEGLRPQPTSKLEYDAVVRDFFDLDVAEQDANRAAFAGLWAFMAERYRDNPLVRFSIMNEPFCLVTIPDGRTAEHLAESYSAFMEQVVDAIRQAGATRHKIHVDRPFLWDASGNVVRRVGRNIVWEAHVSLLPAFGGTSFGWFKNEMDVVVRKFVDEFQQPLFIGEYGIDSIAEMRRTFPSDWPSVLFQQTAYLDSLPLAGRQFHCWDQMHGEYAPFDGNSDLTPEESDWILRLVLGGS